MKTNKFYFTAAGFLTGLVLGISIFGLVAFKNSPDAPGGGVGPVSSTDANTYFKNYMSSATPLNQVVKGFTIDKTQFDAMSMINQENSALTGFRIYLGKDNNARKVAIVVGVDSYGKDAVGNTIYNTDSQGTNPCPPVCDASSPIIK